jgi:uncharacterized protein
MDNRTIIAETAQHVERLMHGEGSGHDWWHVHRVWRTAIRIATGERADMLVVELASLLHDVADWKFRDGDETAGGTEARRWLERFPLAEDTIRHVCQIIDDLSFKGAGVPTDMHSREGDIVQDADRLDAIGAIGIARAFAYGGHAGQQLYDPAIPPEHHASFEAYKRSRGPTINHFYEKLLLLKDGMKTETGRAIARERHEYMVSFLARFIHEWEGTS